MKVSMGVALAALLAGAPWKVLAEETFRCHLPDGRVVFQQSPCPLAEMAPPEAPTRPAAPRPPAVAAQPAPVPVPAKPAAPPAASRPAPAPVAAAPSPAPAPAPAAADEPFVKPTKRKRDILELSAQFERCRADVPGFAEKSAPIHAAWNRRHAGVLSEFEGQLAAKVRAGRRGEATLPLRVCTDDWLRQVEPLTRTPDARFASVEKTWQVFMGALMTGDRATALGCLAGRAESRWKERVARLSDEELRRIAASIRAMKVQWGDDYEKDAIVADTDNRAVGIAFRNLNEEWKITDWGGPAPALPVPAVKE